MVLNRRSLERSFSPMSKVKKKSIHGRKSLLYSPGSARKANTKRQSNVKVVVRVRPSNDKELGDNYRSVVQLVDDKMLVFDPKIDEPSFFYHGVKQSCRDLLKKQNKDTTYIFDKVFGFTSTNEEVFEGSTKEMITTLLSGYNCSVFVYGATGAGKTYTMLGSADSPGITYLTMVELYSEMEKLKDEKTFDLCVSYLEVYNENVRDLLQPSGPLHVREDARAGVSVAGLKMETIDSADKLLAMLAQGNKNRTQHPTDANSESSRSHAVFQVHIRMTHRLSNQMSLVKLSMVDLAGSERGSATGCTGARFTEGANINKSLLALGNCINNLADGLKHIPYRDSKLTRLLKDSLGGNCYTVMIANVSPSSKSYEDTQNTLKYATRAMKIKSTVKSNVVNCEMHVSQYARLVEELNRKVAAQNEEISKLKEQLNSSVVNVVNEERASEKECDDIHHWRKKLREMYKIKKKLNVEILLVEMKRKILHWRAYTKQKVAARVAVLCYDNEQLQQAVDRIEMSQRQYRAREESFACVLKTIKDQKSKHSEEMDSAMKLIEEAGFTDSLKEEILVNDLQVERENAEIKSQYLKKLINLQQNEMEGHYIMFQTICHMMKEYYLMLKGFGKETNAMKESYQEAVRMMVGIKNVTWEDAQNDHMKYLKELLRLSASLNDRIACDQTPVANEGILLQDLNGKDSSCLASKGSEQLAGIVDLSLSCNEKSSDWTMKSYATSPTNNEMFSFEDVSPECSLYYTDKMGIEVRKKFSKDIRRTIFSDDTEETETHSQEADAAILKCEAEKISELLKNESGYYSPKIVPEPDLDNMFSCVLSTTNRTNNSALCETPHISPQTRESEIDWLRQVDFKNDSEEVHCEEENSGSHILQVASKPDLNATFSCEVEIKTHCSDSVTGEAACALQSNSEGQQLKSHMLPPVSESELNNTFSCETQSQNASNQTDTCPVPVSSKKEEKEFCFLRPADVKCSVKKLQAASHNSTLDSTFCFARDADTSRKPVVEKLSLEPSFVTKRPTEKCKDITNKTFIQPKKLVSSAVPGKRNILSSRNTTNIIQKDFVSPSEVKHLGNTGKVKNLVRAQVAQNSALNKENIYSPNITKRKIQRSESMKLPVKKNQESMLPSKRVSPSNVCSGIASYQQVVKPAANRHRNISSAANLIYGSKTLPETRVKNTCLLRSS